MLPLLELVRVGMSLSVFYLMFEPVFFPTNLYFFPSKSFILKGCNDGKVRMLERV